MSKFAVKEMITNNKFQRKQYALNTLSLFSCVCNDDICQMSQRHTYKYIDICVNVGHILLVSMKFDILIDKYHFYLYVIRVGNYKSKLC